jgi:adenylylsulfate kinase
MDTPFALWITGLPASGKSTITAALVAGLRKRGIDPIVLESDVFRKYFVPQATHSEEDRVSFYQGIIEIAAMILERGIPVVIDATGSRRAYRTPARERFPKFAEVFVDCPLEVCIGRKGIEGSASRLQAEYESPIHPEIRIRSDHEDPDEAARKILEFLISSGWIPSRRLYRV